MNKKLLALALGSTLVLGTSAAHAGYYEYANNLKGNFLISGFNKDLNDTDGDSNTYSFSLTGLTGSLDLTIPANGTYGVSRNGVFNVDYIPGITLPGFGCAAGSGFDLCSDTHGAWVGLTDSFNFQSSNITGKHFIYDFDNGIFKSDNVDITGGQFDMSVSGFKVLLGIFFGPVLSPALSAALGDGSVDVNYTVSAGTWTINVKETDVGGTGISGALSTLDLQSGLGGLPPSNHDGKIDGSFLANGRLHIPEPGTMAVLGLGLAGLSMVRRRKVV